MALGFSRKIQIHNNSIAMERDAEKNYLSSYRIQEDGRNIFLKGKIISATKVKIMNLQFIL